MKNNDKENSRLFGIVLMLIGVFFLLDRILPWLDFGYFWPIIMIIVGSYYVLRKN